MAKTKPTKPITIKDRVWQYMEINDLSYQDMCDKLNIKHVQSFHRWLNNPSENFASKIERLFNELVELDDLS